MESIDKEFNMTSSSNNVKIQDLPFNKNVQPLVIQDLLVQKCQKTMKQHPPGTEIDVFTQDPNDWRCQNMWNGCEELHDDPSRTRICFFRRSPGWRWKVS